VSPPDALVVHLTWLWPDALVIPVGEMDRVTTHLVEARLREALDGDAERVVVDASALRSVDPDGMRALSTAARVLRQRGGELLLVDPPRCLDAMLAALPADGDVHVTANAWNRSSRSPRRR
jgi:anti-anti-sigma factor